MVNTGGIGKFGSEGGIHLVLIFCELELTSSNMTSCLGPSNMTAGFITAGTLATGLDNAVTKFWNCCLFLSASINDRDLNTA